LSFHERVAKAGSFVDFFGSLRKHGKSVEKEMDRIFAGENGLYDLIGLKTKKIGRGSVEMSFDFSRFVSGHDRHRRVHGGVMMYALDMACTLAVMSVNRSPDQATLELKTNFLRPLAKDPFIVRAKVVKSGKVVVVSEGEVVDSEGVLCARSLGTWFLSGG
jgi:uncharacterized protein (TIGR00369 family)